MYELAHVYVAITAIGAAMSLVLAYQARRRRAAPGSGPLAILMIALAFWFSSYWAVWSTNNLESQLLWHRTVSSFTLLMPALLLAFVLEITGQKWRTPTRIALLAVVPVLSFIVLWWAPRDLMYSAITPVRIGEFTHYSLTPGPVFGWWLVLLYSLFLVSIAILLRSTFSSAGVQRAQSATVLVGALLPIGVSLVNDLTGLAPPGEFDPVPIAVLFSTLLFVVALSQEWLLGLVSQARELVVERMEDGAIVIDGQGNIVDVNPAAARFMNLTRAEMLDTAGAAALDGLESDERSGHSPDDNAELVPIHRDDGPGQAELNITPLVGRFKNPVGTLVTLHDVTEARFFERTLREANEGLRLQLEEIRHLQAELREQAIRDPLTNLLNRRFLEEAMQAEVARAVRAGTPIGLIALDIDLFKEVNDTRSHQAGDAALIMVADTLVRSVRAGDIVCRLGGDEFVVVLPGCDREPAYWRAEATRLSIAETPVRSGESEFSVTVSAGVSVFPSDGDTGEAALNAADRALYAAKESGRNQTRMSAQPV